MSISPRFLYRDDPQPAFAGDLKILCVHAAVRAFPSVRFPWPDCLAEPGKGMEGFLDKSGPPWRRPRMQGSKLVSCLIAQLSNFSSKLREGVNYRSYGIIADHKGRHYTRPK
ncbi:MAG: hypothetical protein ACRD3O_22810, partial [Terriglobia bacterium]